MLYQKQRQQQPLKQQLLLLRAGPTACSCLGGWQQQLQGAGAVQGPCPQSCCRRPFQQVHLLQHQQRRLQNLTQHPHHHAQQLQRLLWQQAGYGGKGTMAQQQDQVRGSWPQQR
jgi:hypothetical protein